MLKYRNRHVIRVKDWDKLVTDTYKRPYNFQQQDGCQERGVFDFTVPNEAWDFKNDTLPEIVNHGDMGVSFAAWMARDPTQKLEEQKYDWSLEMWWERNFYPDIQMVANDLHRRGLLEAGDYIIEIDW